MAEQTKDKIRAALEGSVLAALATVTAEGRPWVRYVTIHTADDLRIRCVTSLSSRKVAHIRENRHVHLVCGVTVPAASNQYLQIAGYAQISTEPDERRANWHDSLREYFTGPDDPEYCVLIVRPARIEYYPVGATQPEVWEA